jgi:hypothetical protein
MRNTPVGNSGRAPFPNKEFPEVLSSRTADGRKSLRGAGPHTAVESCGTSDNPAFA